MLSIADGNIDMCLQFFVLMIKECGKSGVTAGVECPGS